MPRPKRKLTELGLTIEAFLQSVSNMSQRTADTYRLYSFLHYAKTKHTFSAVSNEYYKAKEHEATAMFRKIEQYLTFQEVAT